MRSFAFASLVAFALTAIACGQAPEPTGNRCAGISGKQCPSGETCIDDPNDWCDPQNDDKDCSGICVK